MQQQQFEHYDETEILTLMLDDQDEFVRYIARRHKNVCGNGTRLLHPIVWAVHFNVPRRQRLRMLDDILERHTVHVRTRYSFLPEKQIVGQTYKTLGIPTICGKPDRYFLTAYKKYKSCYPKNEKPVIFNDKVNRNSIETDTGTDNGNGYCAKRIINSTPNIKKNQNFKMNSSPSPIRISTENTCPGGLSTNSFFTRFDSNTRNTTQNGIDNNYGVEISPNAIKRECGRQNVHNNNTISSQQTLHDVHAQQNTESSDYSHGQMYFISRDPKYIRTENDISRLDEHGLSDVPNEIHSSGVKTEYTDNDDDTSVYLRNSKCRESSTVGRAGQTRYISKQRINDRHRPNVTNNSIPSPSTERGCCNDTWRRDMSDSSADTAAQNYNSEDDNVMTFSESTPSKGSTDRSSDGEKNTSRNTSDTSWSNIVCSNSTNGSYPVDAAVKRKFLEWSDESDYSNNDNETST